MGGGYRGILVSCNFIGDIMQINYRKHAVTIIVFIFTAITIIPVQAAELPGSLDKSFGAIGKVTTDAVLTDPYSTDYPLGGMYSSVATQSDRKVVVFGVQNELLRFNVDGHPDSGFGVNGVVDTGTFGAAYGGGADIAIQADGKIVIAGRDGGGSTFRLERYNSDGTPDTTFGVNGVVQTSINIHNSGSTRSLVIQNNGKLVIGGTATTSSYCYQHWGSTCDYYNSGVMIRYNADGSQDASFGTNGVVIAAKPTPDTTGWISDIALDASGNIVVAGANSSTEVNGTLSRYTSNGTLDPTFGVSGVVNGVPAADEVLLYGDGRILLSGGGVLSRYFSNGAIDSSFGSNGTLTGLPSPASVALVGDEIVVGGTRTTSRQTNKQYWTFAGGYYVYLYEITKVYNVSRYFGNGLLDTSFGDQGVATVNFNGNDTLSELTIDAAGKIVITGATDKDALTEPVLQDSNRYQLQFALARLNR